jgi:N-acetylmuramic acid 6-phosphate etherase
MDHLQTEARNPASTNLDELSPLELARLMNAEDARVVPAVGSQLEKIARAVEIIAERLRNGGRLVYLGAGTSGRLGVLDAAECPPTFNSDPGQVCGLIAGGEAALTRAVEGAEDHPELAVRDLEGLGLTNGDAVVGIATSGRTPYVLGGVEHARRLGSFTVGIVCNPESELTAAVDLPITLEVGPEVLSGSTRLKAGTATKLVLNMLSTGVMVSLGKAYGNLMVDLRATNSKLRARSNRIIRIVTGLGADDADRLLKECGGELKTALVARMCMIAPEEARERLRAAGGRMRAALAGHTQSPNQASESSIGSLLLGIDGGGTHTTGRLAKASPGAGRLWSSLARSQSGPSNRQSVGDGRALAALEEVVATLFAQAGIARQPVAVACLGLAGADRPEDRDFIQDWSSRIGLAKRVIVANDAETLLAAGTPHGNGIALVAGTGSIAYGRAADGRTARAGGWGHLFGDEGSAYGIALAGLRAVARAADGRDGPTCLTEEFLKKLGLQRPQQLVPAIYGRGLDRASLAALAPLVLEAAPGDRTAAQIVEHSASELVQAVAAVARKLWRMDKPFPFAIAGGLLVARKSYRGTVLDAIRSAGLAPDPVKVVDDPSEGALRLALNALVSNA